MAFWENLIKESESKFEPANYVDVLFCCACRSADIFITAVNNKKFKLSYIVCGKMDIKIKTNRENLLMIQSEQSWQALDNKIKKMFKAALEEFQIQK